MHNAHKQATFKEYFFFSLFSFCIACIVGLVVALITHSQWLSWIAADIIYVAFVWIHEEVFDDEINLTE